MSSKVLRPISCLSFDLRPCRRTLTDSTKQKDIDGVRVITNGTCDFLQKVPEVTEDVFRFGTESPASILLDAVEQLEAQSPKADDNIQLIRPNLTEAVDTCVCFFVEEDSLR